MRAGALPFGDGGNGNAERVDLPQPPRQIQRGRESLIGRTRENLELAGGVRVGSNCVIRGWNGEQAPRMRSARAFPFCVELKVTQTFTLRNRSLGYHRGQRRTLICHTSFPKTGTGVSALGVYLRLGHE